MKIKLDENMPKDAQAFLRARGHDVSTAAEEGLAGEADPLVQHRASEEERILLTFDLDFADVRSYPPGTHAGIVVFRLHDQRWKTLKSPLERVFDEQTLDTLNKGLAIVSQTNIRFKRASTKKPR